MASDRHRAIARRRTIEALIVQAAMLAGPRARAEDCRPLRVARANELPPSWRAAADALVTASADAAQPWGCPAAELSITPEADGGASITVARQTGEVIVRHLDAPDDLVPVGKALLARPQHPPAAPAPPTGNPSATAPIPVDDDAPATPRAYLEAGLVLRFLGGTRAVLAGGAARGDLPFGRFHAGIWVRYAAAIATADPDRPDLFVGELGIGAAAGYRLLFEPAGLDLALTTAVVVVDFGAAGLAGDAAQASPEDVVESGAVDGRIGLELRLTPALAPGWHALVAVDGEIAPAALVTPVRRVDPQLPPLPTFTVGLRLGVEGDVP